MRESPRLPKHASDVPPLTGRHCVGLRPVPQGLRAQPGTTPPSPSKATMPRSPAQGRETLPGALPTGAPRGPEKKAERSLPSPLLRLPQKNGTFRPPAQNANGAPPGPGGSTMLPETLSSAWSRRPPCAQRRCRPFCRSAFPKAKTTIAARDTPGAQALAPDGSGLCASRPLILPTPQNGAV